LKEILLLIENVHSYLLKIVHRYLLILVHFCLRKNVHCYLPFTKVFVTPENEDDLMKYLKDIRGFYSHLTDRVAKRYSRNGQFVLHGLCYKNKWPHILYKRL